MKKEKITKFIFAILICHTAGIVGSIFNSAVTEDWYAYLDKPWFQPPNWIFAPVWLTLFTLMGISLYFIWSSRSKDKNALIWFFIIHLLFNAFWSILFFGLQQIFAALIFIVILWLMIGLIISRFSNVSKLAAYLLVPYFFWVSFALLLNFSIWMLNR